MSLHKELKNFLFVLSLLSSYQFCFTKLGCTSTIKIKILCLFILYCARFALTLFRQVRLHLDNKNKSLLVFYFVLCSVCTNFVRNLENKTNLSW